MGTRVIRQHRGTPTAVATSEVKGSAAAEEERGVSDVVKLL